MKNDNSMKKTFSSRRFKMGGFQTLVMAIVIVVVVVLNLIVGKMGIMVDLSSDKIYTLTEDTKNLVNELSDEVTMYYLCQDGNEALPIEKVLGEYDKLGKVEVVKKDPIIYPNFSKEYTDEEIAENDVIVVNAAKERSVHVKAADMVLSDIDYSTYQKTNSLDVEGQITSAIQSVTSVDAKKIYLLEGHNEVQPDSCFADIIKKSNITTATLNLTSAKAVPGDCDILLINGPTYDITTDEYTILSSYLKEGGKAFIFLNVQAEKQKNLDKLMSDYGIDVQEGYLIEETGSGENSTIILPTAVNHDITSEVGEKPVYAPVTVGMVSQSDVRSTLTVESLLNTAENCFSRTDMTAQANKKIDSDIAGPFSVAMAATDKYAENTKGQGYATKLLVYGSCDFATAMVAESEYYGNRSMLIRSLSWLVGEETSTLVIPTRSLDTEVVVIDSSDRIFWTAALVVVIPMGLLAIGFVIWYRRRKN